MILPCGFEDDEEEYEDGDDDNDGKKLISAWVSDSDGVISCTRAFQFLSTLRLEHSFGSTDDPINFPDQGRCLYLR